MLRKTWLALVVVSMVGGCVAPVGGPADGDAPGALGKADGDGDVFLPFPQTAGANNLLRGLQSFPVGGDTTVSSQNAVIRLPVDQCDALCEVADENVCTACREHRILLPGGTAYRLPRMYGKVTVAAFAPPETDEEEEPEEPVIPEVDTDAPPMPMFLLRVADGAVIELELSAGVDRTERINVFRRITVTPTSLTVYSRDPENRDGDMLSGTYPVDPSEYAVLVFSDAPPVPTDEPEAEYGYHLVASCEGPAADHMEDSVTLGEDAPDPAGFCIAVPRAEESAE